MYIYISAIYNPQLGYNDVSIDTVLLYLWCELRRLYGLMITFIHVYDASRISFTEFSGSLC